jgi:hypothetical protein
MENPVPFFQTTVGRVLRWLMFVPTGLLLMLILDSLLLSFLNWIFGNDLKKFVIIGIFLGGLATVVPMSYLLYSSIGRLVAWIAPIPKMASFIFSAIIIITLVNSIYNWNIQNMPNFWTASIMQAFTTMFVIIGLFDE